MISSISTTSSITWIPSSAYSGVPGNAVAGGHDIDGSPIYVGRAHHAGDLIPAKVIPSKHLAYVAHGGQEIAKSQFEILCGSNFTWAQAAHGSIPPNALSGGHTSNGEPLYIGRIAYEGAITVGKVHPTHGSLYIPFAGREVSFKQYDVLVQL